MAYETILYEVQDGVAVITLNRPDVLNALNDQMARELQDALRQAERDAQVRAVVLTGAGRAFCSGQDLKAVAGELGRRSLGQHLRATWNPIVRRVREMEKPVLCALNGVAAGAGCSLALACDLRIASEQASLIEVFARVGLIPDSGSTWLLPRLVGLARALELAFTAEPVDAHQAERLGLVNRVVPHERLMDETLALARRLASGPTRAYGLTKRAMNRAWQMGFAEALEYEAMLQEAAGRSEDHVEGVRAFLEKRPAQFRGR